MRCVFDSETGAVRVIGTAFLWATDDREHGDEPSKGIGNFEDPNERVGTLLLVAHFLGFLHFIGLREGQRKDKRKMRFVCCRTGGGGREGNVSWHTWRASSVRT